MRGLWGARRRRPTARGAFCARTCTYAPAPTPIAHPPRLARTASLVVVGGYMIAAFAAEYAAAHPGVSFITVMPRLSAEVQGYAGAANGAFVTARMYEGYYLSGFAAATVMTAGKAGFVTTLEVAEVAARANAFLLGVRSAVAAGLSPLSVGAPVSLQIYYAPATLTNTNEAFAAELLLAAGVEGESRERRRSVPAARRANGRAGTVARPRHRYVSPWHAVTVEGNVMRIPTTPAASPHAAHRSACRGGGQHSGPGGLRRRWAVRYRRKRR